MLYWIWEQFGDQVSWLNLARYITIRSVAAALVSFAIVLFFAPRFIAWVRALQFEQNIRVDGPETHLKKQGTPTMGGLLIFAAFSISVLLFGNPENVLVVLVFLMTLAFATIGFVDDLLCVLRTGSKGLSGKLRLTLETLIVAGVVAILLVHPEWSDELWVPLFKDFHPGIGWMYIPFAILVVAGTANGVNLTDGLDGLATGVALPVLASLGVMTYATGHIEFARYLGIFYSSATGELTVLVGALMGSLLGFLWHNSHPASMFMGDTGSLGIGGFIGILAVTIKQELLLPLIGFVFVMETLSVILQVGSYKLRGGKRIFRMAPIHHHFEQIGWPESKIIVRFWIIGLVCAVAGLAMLKVR